jgi:hypothetical protein
VLWQMQVIVDELVVIAKSQYSQRPGLTLTMGLVAAMLLLRGAGCIASAMFSPRPPEDFSFRRVVGRIAYTDGSPIPSRGMLICFAERHAGDATRPTRSLGCTIVDDPNGDFTTTLRMPSSSVASGTIVVTIASAAGDPLPTHIMPAEYAVADATPLVVDITGRTLDVRLPKP